MFNLGKVVATPGALETLRISQDPMMVSKLLARHLSGDWGDLDDEDKQANDAAVRDGSRILSAYKVFGVPGAKVWVITEAADANGNREATTFLLPSEY
jgi:hypothetical protein